MMICFAYQCLAIVLASLQGILGNQLSVVNVPASVKLSNAKEVSISDVQALPFHLFGLDETQSGLVADVSFFRRPSLLAVIALACGDACAEVDAELSAASGAASARRFKLQGGGGGEPLTYQPTSLADAAAKAGLAKSLLAGSGELADSSHPDMFAGVQAADSLPAALSDESGLPVATRRELCLARALVDRAAAAGLLSDAQPDAIRIDISVAGLAPDARARVLDFAVKLAARLTEAAGPDRAFVAMATVSAAAADKAPELIRVGRSLMAAAEAAPGSANPLNLAQDYKDDFPVMFNLILWLSVVLALAVYAVAYSLWNIDPGKDSIIYRRGYAHAKKD